MKEPIVSVVMAVYNSEKYLAEAIESILNQSFQDFEFIIINDGSTDNSESILQGFRAKDKRIQVISRPNTGFVTALIEGLSYSQGKYIARMDADDLAMPDRFAQQVQYLDQNPEFVAVGSRVLLIDPEGLPIMPFAIETEHENIDAAHLKGKGGAIVHPATMFRCKAVQAIGNYRRETEPAEDLDLFLRLAERGKLKNLPTTLLKYRMHLKSTGHSRRLEQSLKAKMVVEQAYQRRGLTLPQDLNFTNQYNSTSQIHQKWAWWALGDSNLKTARKHAWLALRKKPNSIKSWKAFACAIRGY